MIKRKEDQNFVDRFDEIYIVNVLIYADINITQKIAEYLDDIFEKLEVFFTEVILKQSCRCI